MMSLLVTSRRRVLAAAMMIVGILGSGIHSAVAAVNRPGRGLGATPRAEVEPVTSRSPDAFLHSLRMPQNVPPAVLTRRDAVAVEVLARAKMMSRDQALSTAAALCDEAQRLHYDPLLFLAIISVESSFNYLAVSYVGARGLMQVMPQTAQFLAAHDKIGGTSAEGFDPVANVRMGTRYIAQLDRQFHHHMDRTLTAYNRGATATHAILAAHKTLPACVRQPYADRIMAQYRIFLQHYGHLAAA